jgi:uncharacterized protein (DUF488 family)
LRILIVGHSTRTFDELVGLLTTYQVATLVDVRSFPRSLTNPQFNTEVLQAELPNRGIQYVWLKKLGGRRKGLGRRSRNTCWKNVGFRNYADYMETPMFQEGIAELFQIADESAATIMCAEAVYWCCHRSMIADFLKSKGVQVEHIFDEKHTREHEYTKCARIREGQLTHRE